MSDAQKIKLRGHRILTLPARKRCSGCKVVKDKEEFGTRFNGRLLKSHCKKCERGARVKKYHSNKAAAADAFRRSWLKMRYGITEAQYDDILAKQCGVCAICRREKTGKRRFAVDHDHGTQIVRGVLCDGCNMGLGKFCTRELLEAALAYLENPPATGII